MWYSLLFTARTALAVGPLGRRPVSSMDRSRRPQSSACTKCEIPNEGGSVLDSDMSRTRGLMCLPSMECSILESNLGAQWQSCDDRGGNSADHYKYLSLYKVVVSRLREDPARTAQVTLRVQRG